MKATIIRFEGPYAICIKEDNSVVDIKRFNIPMGAKEGCVLNVNGSSITMENQPQEKYPHADDVILDWWHGTNEL